MDRPFSTVQKMYGIYIPDYDKAVEFGRQKVVVYLIEAKG
jgi:hypothetical protein